MLSAGFGCAAWTTVQYIGYKASEFFKFVGPHGQNVFEPPNVYLFNLLYALSAAPIVPYVVDYISSRLRNPEESSPDNQSEEQH